MKLRNLVMIFFSVIVFYSNPNGSAGLSTPPVNDLAERLRHDVSLVAPGAGAEGVLLGDDANAVLKRYGRVHFRLSRPPGLRDLFKDVFKVDGSLPVYFESIYYGDEKKIAICVLRNKIRAVIGFSSDRTTIHGIDLRKGVNNLIFNYGNRGIAMLKKGSSCIYLYRNLGMAVVDDDMNDDIDLYVVFIPPSK